MSTAEATTRSITFSDEEVWDTLDGTTNKIWRPIKPQPQIFGQCQSGYLVDDSTFANEQDFRSGYCYVRKCPYGEAKFFGHCDRFWVQEAWSNINKPVLQSDIYYLADAKYAEDYDASEWDWQPAIDMPRWASRITVEITCISVERRGELEGWLIGFKVLQETKQ